MPPAPGWARNGVVFIDQRMTVPVPAAVALERLGGFFQLDGLHVASRAAYRDGRRLLVRAGVAGVSKRVNVRSLPPFQRGDTTVIAFSWYATGPLGEVFPPLDADLEITPADGGGTTLALIGVYRPPAGRLGQSLDQLVLHRVAEATTRGFLTRLAKAVTTSRHAPAVENGGPPLGEPVTP